MAYILLFAIVIITICKNINVFVIYNVCFEINDSDNINIGVK